jgi:hypothetical protein
VMGDNKCNTEPSAACMVCIAWPCMTPSKTDNNDVLTATCCGSRDDCVPSGMERCSCGGGWLMQVLASTLPMPALPALNGLAQEAKFRCDDLRRRELMLLKLLISLLPLLLVAKEWLSTRDAKEAQAIQGAAYMQSCLSISLATVLDVNAVLRDKN